MGRRYPPVPMEDHIALGREMAELDHRLIVLSVKVANLVGKSTEEARALAMAAKKLSQVRSDMENRMARELSQSPDRPTGRDFTKIYYPGVNRSVEEP